VISFLRLRRVGAMSNRKTSVEINEELLEEAREILATSTIRETIEEAFREVVRHRARVEEIEALATMKGMDLHDGEVMGRAWRD
jgi:Arc/MetJ family transcription regulator